MKCSCPFVTTTPSDYDIEGTFGYTTNGRNFPGLLGLTFQPETTIAGYSITAQTSMLSLAFPNLKSIPANALAAFSGNTVMTSLYFGVLASVVPNFNISNNAALTSIIAPMLTTVTGIIGTGLNSILVFTLPALAVSTGIIQVTGATLATITLNALINGATLTFSGNAALTSLNLNALTSLTGGLNLTADTALVTLSLPLVTTMAAVNASGCTTLANVSFPNYLPTNGGAINFSAAALTQASVDHVLARAVANAAYVTGTITLDGGTSSPPGTQGALDKATLQARGVAVLTN